MVLCMLHEKWRKKIKFPKGSGNRWSFRLRSMDHAATEPAPPVSEIDDWDNDDFVIPSLIVSESKHDSWDESGVTDQKPPPKSKIKEKEAETLYLGPHGAPPQAKLEAPSTTSTWKHTNNNTIKNKPKETANRKNKSSDH